MINIFQKEYLPAILCHKSNVVSLMGTYNRKNSRKRNKMLADFSFLYILGLLEQKGDLETICGRTRKQYTDY